MSNPSERLNAALADRYRIERELGAGGMATVFLAEDLKHKRKVALKVLKPELAAVLGAERFVQEITTTASLQHPHILPLFDSGTADGFLYYVMPFIEGETLRDKLNRETQLGVDEAVRIAREVADALDYAHGKGIIHRDIKPENILIQNGRPMVADFGIALAVSAAAGGRMTETGLSLGTPHYMSPEQATADKEISARSDVYSLASVLYESLAGQPPHVGGSAQQIIMKIIAEPVAPVTQLRKTVPPNVAAALAKALEKLPADRFESAKAFAAALADPGFRSGTATSARGAGTGAPTWSRVTVTLAGVSAVLALLLAREKFTRGTSHESAPVVRFNLANDQSHGIHTASTRPFAVSPDGRMIVYRALTDSTGPHLWVRNIEEPQPRKLEGTADGMNPAFSPDGQTIAFLVQNKSLRTVPIAGGNVRQIATVESVAAALTWASNEEIVFEQINPDGGIHRINATGGSPELVIPLDTVAGEVKQRRPLAVREAGIIVYESTTRARSEAELALYRPSDGRRVQTGLSGIDPLAVIDGRLIYSGVTGELMAVRFDAGAMRVEGSPVKLTTRASVGWTGSGVALSGSGTLVYRTEGTSTDARLDLVDTTGTGRSLPGAYAVNGTPRFSPDGRRVALGVGTEGVIGRRRGIAFSDIWVVDVASGEPTRLTSGVAGTGPSWLDRDRVAYGTDAGGRPQLWSVPVGGSAAPSLLVDVGGAPRSSAATPNGKAVLISTATVAGGALLRSWLDGSGRLDTLISLQQDGIRAEDPRVSPDGKWVAFIERSSYAVWMRSLTGSARLQVSLKGTDGNPVVWGPDSRRLYYADSEGLHVIELQTEPTLSVTRRRLIGRFPSVTDYDLTPDGRTFIVVSPIRSTSDVVVVVNWADEARRTWNAPPAR